MVKSFDDPNKVMDVSKPGKGKIMTTSRPVITSGEATKDTMVNDTSNSLSPSGSHRVIQPLTTIQVDSPDDDSNITPDAIDVTVESTKSTSYEESDVANEQEKEKSESIEPKPVEVEKAEAPKPPEPKPDTQTPESSESATVDAIASGVGSKKEAAKKAEDEAKRDAAIQELIDSKKYHVNLGHDSTRKTPRHHNQTLTVVLIIILAALIAAYLAVDAGFIESSIELPYELIK